MDKLNFLRELVLGFLALSSFLIMQLAVSAFLFSADFLFLSMSLFDFTLAKKFNMLLLKLLVHTTLCHLLMLAVLLLLDLSIEFVLDQLAALLFSHHSLFLFFVVQQCVEFLNGNPLIVLSKFRENLRLGGLT